MSRSPRLKQLVTALLLSFFGAVCAEAARAEAVTIPLQSYVDGLYTVQLTVNGQTGTFLFDTGEGLSVLSPDFATRVHCEPWGQITGFRFSGDRLDAPHCDQLTFQDFRPFRRPARCNA